MRGSARVGKAVRGFFEAPFANPAHLVNVCSLPGRLRYCFETLPCLSIGCADLQSLDTMQPVERKRQGYIHELIQTEERYVDDLQLVVEVRAVPAEGGGPWPQSQASPLMWEFTSRVASSDRSSHTLRMLCGSGRVPEEPKCTPSPRRGHSGWREQETPQLHVGRGPIEEGEGRG